ncbi:MAG TPA: serine hydrolase domain-containing protein [Solirubrobacterales bacterium]|nr:serine hydrolase domain-containing protein [Solirubrobacterales bacterium]
MTEFRLPAEAVVAPGFEPVAEEFERNFEERGELGAAFAVHHRGELVLDLWGGVADRESGAPWERDTLQLIFSGSKGLVAICLLLLIDRGLLDLEEEVRAYWPEFAAAGKGEITVRQVVTHTAGLPGLSEPVTVEELTDDRRMAELLAAQAPLEDPRTATAYHPITFGWLCGELVRRIDGRSVGRFFAEEIALGLEIFIGLPPELEPRVARLEVAPGWGQAGPFDAAAAEEDNLLRTVFHNPVVWTRESFPWNSSTYRRAEIPAVNAIGSARALAALYGSLDRLLSPEALALGASELGRRHDLLLDEHQRFGVGFELQNELMPFGPPADAFGHTGAGGSVHGRWPGSGLGFSYAMNLLHDDYADGDPRPAALLRALSECVEAGA